MTLKETAEKYYKIEDYNCAETLIHAANEYYDLGLHEEDMKMMAGFGGGMFVGSTCGALVGATAALSRLIVKDRAHRELDQIRPACQRLYRNFRTGYGQESTLCKDLKPHWHSAEEKCWPTVARACEILEETADQLLDKS